MDLGNVRESPVYWFTPWAKGTGSIVVLVLEGLGFHLDPECYPIFTGPLILKCRSYIFKLPV